jgi:hypothetical protein
MAIKTYLGDQVYADYDGFHVTLTTENGIQTTNIIYLEPAVLQAFNVWLARVRPKPADTPADNPGETDVGKQWR